MADVTADMNAFEVRDALREAGGNSLTVMNFNDPGEEPVSVIAVSGQLVAIFKQVIATFNGDGGELRIIPPGTSAEGERGGP
jgi:hypothetical protein